MPAIGKSDTEISKRENKEKNDDDGSKLHEQLPTKQHVVVVASSWPDDDDEPTEIVEKLAEKLKLSYDQSKKVQFYLDQDGKGYVLEKVALTRSKDLRNAGGFFMRALEKDYREPVTNAKPPPPPNKKRVEPKPEEPPATDEERAQTRCPQDPRGCPPAPARFRASKAIGAVRGLPRRSARARSCRNLERRSSTASRA
jgi:hypothetical protein